MTLWQLQSKHFELKSRLAFLAAGIAVFILSYAVGALGVHLSKEEASEISSSFANQVQGIEGAGIFSNNVVIGLGMFIPGAGAGIGIYSGFTTGIVFNAFQVVTPDLAGLSPLSVFATSFGVLELFAYGLGISRSGLLVRDLVKRRPWRQYIVITLIEIGIAIAMLLSGALIEGNFLNQ